MYLDIRNNPLAKTIITKIKKLMEDETIQSSALLASQQSCKENMKKQKNIADVEKQSKSIFV